MNPPENPTRPQAVWLTSLSFGSIPPVHRKTWVKRSCVNIGYLPTTTADQTVQGKGKGPYDPSGSILLHSDAFLSTYTKAVPNG